MLPRSLANAVCALALGLNNIAAPASAQNTHGQPPQTRYLTFQIFTYAVKPDTHDSPWPPPLDIASTVRDIVGAIGTTGNDRDKLGFTVGPLSLDQTADQVRQLIDSSFKIARDNNVAVAFHIDDSMFWPRGAPYDKPANLEWLDWKGTPNTGRRLDWSATPSKIAPQLCLNSPAVQSAVAVRARRIGTEIKAQLDQLRRDHKEQLFAGVIAGWETQIGQDFDTGKYLGYCALTNRGFSATHTPADPDRELADVVHDFMGLWARTLAHAGVPSDKIYSQIAVNASNPGARASHFAPPSVAFSKYYLPGFSTYPDAGTFELIHREVASHGSPAWISAEGTNVAPTGMPGEPTMETYLAKMYNHGGILVNIYSWGMGGPAFRNNFFRAATENQEAIGAYRKFLNGKQLVELAPSKNTFSPAAFQQKIHEIQAELPDWVRRTHGQAKVEPLMGRLDGEIKSQQFVDADRTADEILQVIHTK
jgi:hypothetical protein